MIYVLIIIVLLLTGVILYLLSDRKKVNVDLKYTTDKLKTILMNESDEQVRVFTDRQDFQNLLIEINQLLQTNHEVKADSKRNELVLKRMFSNVSHDLRTPLTVIIGYIESMTVNKNMPYEEQQSLLKILLTKTNTLIELINNFFDLAKLDSGDLLIPLENIVVNEICRQNILGYYDQFSENDIQLELSIPKENILCHANKDVLNRILDNLISNALKYGDISTHKICIEISISQNSPCIRILDNGQNLDKETGGEQMRLFHPLI